MPDPAEQQDLVAKLHQAKLPAWKQTAGRTFEGMVEAVLGALGIDQGTGAAAAGSVLQAIMPIGSPLRLAGNRAKVFEKLLAGAPNPAARTALEEAIKTHPRITSHFTDGVEPHWSTTAAAKMTPNQTAPVVAAELGLNPQIKSAHSFGQSIAHESGHLKDFLKVADRARQRGSTEPPGALFMRLYKAAEKKAGGYNPNPFETSGRTSEAAYDIPRRPGRQQEAQLLARDPSNSALNVATGLNDYDALETLLTYQAQTLPAVRRVNAAVPVPGPLDQLLESLDPMFARSRR